MNREKKVVEAEDGLYLVVTQSVMKLEGGVKESLGMVDLVVRPPRDDNWQINDDVGIKRIQFRI